MLFYLEQTLNGLQLGVMLFLMAAGLTLVFGIMNLVNLAHGSLYMLGAYFAATLMGATITCCSPCWPPRSLHRRHAAIVMEVVGPAHALPARPSGPGVVHLRASSCSSTNWCASSGARWRCRWTCRRHSPATL